MVLMMKVSGLIALAGTVKAWHVLDETSLGRISHPQITEMVSSNN